MFKETKNVLYNKKNSEDIKILFFSDIHYSGNKDNKKMDKLYNTLIKYDVNYICISGDIIDSNKVLDEYENFNYLLDFFKKLSKFKSVFICLGNHDLYSKDKNKVNYSYNNLFWKELNKIDNVYVLDNKHYSDKNVFIMGLTQPFEYYYNDAKKENANTMFKCIEKYGASDIKKIDKCKILLIHSPICLSNEKVMSKLKEYDLILCGHMHNGLVLPLLDEIFDNNIGLISPGRKLFPKLSRGIVKKGDTNIIISSGITKLSRISAHTIRWLNFLFPIGINHIVVTKEKHSTEPC